MFYKRIITGLALVALFVLIFLFSPAWFVCVIAVLITLLATWEYLEMTRPGQTTETRILCLALASSIPVAAMPGKTDCLTGSLFVALLALGVRSLFSRQELKARFEELQLCFFGIFYIGDVIMGLSRESLQSFIYLKLSVAGQLTLFVARTRGPFWSIKPAKSLFLASVCSQTVATLIVIHGIGTTFPAISWKLALFVWGYALSWFVFNDLVKLAAYRFFEHGLLGRKHIERVEQAISG